MAAQEGMMDRTTTSYRRLREAGEAMAAAGERAENERFGNGPAAGDAADDRHREARRAWEAAWKAWRAEAP